MEADFKHTILIVDDETAETETIGRLLEKANLTPVLSHSGESALKLLKESKTPFSIIISRQVMKGMKGTQVLEKAKKIAPDTQRFLIMAASDVDTIINAVNNGAIQRYIRKPWEEEALMAAVFSGLKQYERNLEHEKLLVLAKDQNKKLYDLNCELMENTKSNDRKVKALEDQLNELKQQIQDIPPSDTILLSSLINDIKHQCIVNDIIDHDKFNQVLFRTIRQLYEQFNDIAQRNGFEMPIPQDSSL